MIRKIPATVMMTRTNRDRLAYRRRRREHGDDCCSLLRDVMASAYWRVDGFSSTCLIFAGNIPCQSVGHAFEVVRAGHDEGS